MNSDPKGESTIHESEYKDVENGIPDNLEVNHESSTSQNEYSAPQTDLISTKNEIIQQNPPYSLPQMIPLTEEEKRRLHTSTNSNSHQSNTSNTSGQQSQILYSSLSNSNIPIIGDFPPHPVFKHLLYPKTGGRIGKNYLLWGKETYNYFPFVCLIGPHYLFNMVTFVFIICFNGAFLWFSIYKNIIAGICVSAFCLLLSIISLCMTSFSNPGIIPRGMVYTGKEPAISVCSHCKVARPHGAFHCQDCDCCYYELDHHCPWMGKCVAKNNIRWFYITLSCIFISFLANAIALFSTELAR